MAGRTSSDDAQLELLWSRMMTLFAAARDEMFAILLRHDLTPPHGFALKMLHDGPMRMRDMADRMTCDASYITSVVDRLEELAAQVTEHQIIAPMAEWLGPPDGASPACNRFQCCATQTLS